MSQVIRVSHVRCLGCDNGLMIKITNEMAGLIGMPKLARDF